MHLLYLSDTVSGWKQGRSVLNVKGSAVKRALLVFVCESVFAFIIMGRPHDSETAET